MTELPQQILPHGETLDGTLGVEVVEVTDDVIRGRMPVEDRIRQPYGIVHGGAISAIAESLTSLGTARGVLAEHKIAMGQEINASFMRPIASGHVNALARVRRADISPRRDRNRIPRRQIRRPVCARSQSACFESRFRRVFD